MATTYYLDMDGTIADLYSVDNWLECLRAEDPTPYAMAKPLPLLAKLATLAENGVRFEVISWGAKFSSDDYLAKTEKAKRDWVAHYAPFVSAVHVVPYGTPKSTVAIGEGILVDDETNNIQEWMQAGRGKAYLPNELPLAA